MMQAFVPDNEQSRLEILLVEDNPDDVELTREALQETQSDFMLRVVGDGREALRYLRREDEHAAAGEPALVLLDLNLPAMDGRELLARIKADEGLRHIPVIVLSTSSAREDVRHAYSKHVNCYLSKPVDFDQYVGLLRQLEDFWLRRAILPAGGTAAT